jgi:DNA-directed RNA polymerase beta' subunit
MDRKFHIEQLDQERLIKVNDLPQVSNPVMFNSTNGPTSDGLLSNELFGITKDERSGIYGYLDLGGTFINPYYYKIWLKIDRNLRSCIYETQNFKITSEGYLEPDDNGETGIKFLIKNIDKINFKNTKRDNLLNALMLAKKQNKLFTKKFIIIPPYYRDVETNSSGKVGVGEINKLYVNLLNNIRALSEMNDYGLDLSGGVKGKIQDIMLEIYNWFTLGESIVGGEHTGAGIFKKFGIIRRSVMSKTTDYSVRLVLSAANVNVNKKEDLMVDLNYSAIPLSAACVIAYPFIIYYLRQFFNNEFGGQLYYSYIDHHDGGKLKQVELDNPQIAFSDDRFDKELNEFIHGYSNRFKPVMIPNKEGKELYLYFKGYSITEEQYEKGITENHNMIDRPITWVDIFYIAAVAATEDKMVMISRYPIDSHFNQLYTKMHISSTIQTEPMVINGKFYKWYPRIRREDIGSDTSNRFIDTCQISNPYCKMMGADYDGDQVTVKMPFSVEANQELEKHLNSNGQFIALNGENGRLASHEAIQAMYNLTLVLPDTKLTEAEF